MLLDPLRSSDRYGRNSARTSHRCNLQWHFSVKQEEVVYRSVPFRLLSLIMCITSYHYETLIISTLRCHHSYIHDTYSYRLLALTGYEVRQSVSPSMLRMISTPLMKGLVFLYTFMMRLISRYARSYLL